jgi:hypothetical protein
MILVLCLLPSFLVYSLVFFCFSSVLPSLFLSRVFFRLCPFLVFSLSFVRFSGLAIPHARATVETFRKEVMAMFASILSTAMWTTFKRFSLSQNRVI